jgi:internalin A
MSEMALQLIAQAKKERWKRLDLGHCGIIGKVPDEVAELEDLEELILSNFWHEWDGQSWQETSSQNSGPGNQITQLPAHPPQSLLVLVASNYDLEDITPLQGFKGLQILLLSLARVADISPLQGLIKLQMLDLSGARIADISPLQNLLALQTLDLSGTQVVDITSLKGLTALQTLRLSDTLVADISPLKGHTALQTLLLSGTLVKDILPLQGLNELRKLSLDVTYAYLTPLKTLIEKGLHVQLYDGYGEEYP